MKNISELIAEKLNKQKIIRGNVNLSDDPKDLWESSFTPGYTEENESVLIFGETLCDAADIESQVRSAKILCKNADIYPGGLAESYDEYSSYAKGITRTDKVVVVASTDGAFWCPFGKNGVRIIK